MEKSPEEERMVVRNGKPPPSILRRSREVVEAAAEAAMVEEEDVPPPDGGARAWTVMACSFFCNGILFGIINSSGVFYKEFFTHLTEINDKQAASKAALVQSLAMGTIFVVSPIAGIMVDAIGLRKTTFLGGAIASTGMFLSSFCGYNIQALYFTFGIMYGLGGALAYTPSLAVLGYYFKRRLGMVNGIVAAGSSTFTMLMPYLIEWLFATVKLSWTFRVLAILSAGIMVCGLLFVPPTKRRKRKQATFNMDIWRNRKYAIWASLIPFCLFGYFVPYVYLVEFVKDGFPEGTDGNLPVICIAVTSLVGRLCFGYIADRPKTNAILLQQLSFFMLGLLTMLLPLTVHGFWYLIVIALLMGFFDGCFISLLGPIAYQLCGPTGATQAIGCLLGLCSLPLTLGPYVAGIIHDKTQSYTWVFVLAGVTPVVGSFLMFLIRLAAKQPLEVNGVQVEERKELHPQSNGKANAEPVEDHAEDRERHN